MPVLGLVGILVLGAGCALKAQAGVVSKEEVLFMEIPQVVYHQSGSPGEIINIRPETSGESHGIK